MKSNPFLAAAILSGAVLVLAGCATSEAPADGSTQSEVATAGGASSPECVTEPTMPVTVEEAATCVYTGWITNDADLLEAYGNPQVADDLPEVMDDPGLDLVGCTADGGQVLDGEVCRWEGVNSDGDIAVEVSVIEDDGIGYRADRMAVDQS